jgi:hypothetical protein
MRMHHTTAARYTRSIHYTHSRTAVCAYEYMYKGRGPRTQFIHVFVTPSVAPRVRAEDAVGVGIANKNKLQPNSFASPT